MSDLVNEIPITLPEGIVRVSVAKAFGSRPCLRVTTDTDDNTPGFIRIRSHGYRFTLHVCFGGYEIWCGAAQGVEKRVGWQVCGERQAFTRGGAEIKRGTPTNDRLNALACRAAEAYAELVPDWMARSEIASLTNFLHRVYEDRAYRDYDALDWWRDRHQTEAAVYVAAAKLAADSPMPVYGLPFDAPHYRSADRALPWVVHDRSYEPYNWRAVVHVPGCWSLETHQHHLTEVSGSLVSLQLNSVYNAVHGCIPDEAARVYLPDGTVRFRPLEYARHPYAVVVNHGNGWALHSWHSHPNDKAAACESVAEAYPSAEVITRHVVYS